MPTDPTVCRHFGPDYCDDAIASWIDAARATPEDRRVVLALLPEQSPAFVGKSTNESARLRGYLLAAFARIGLPAEGLPYVLEELESGQEAYLIAAAARALRGLSPPHEDLVSCLLEALRRVRSLDDTISFERYAPRWPFDSPTTATAEILRTLGEFGSRAERAVPRLEAFARDPNLSVSVRAELDHTLMRIRGSQDRAPGCCCVSEEGKRSPGLTSGVVSPPDPIADLPLQDQSGARLRFGEYFADKPALIAFFYTRCDNPNKCSWTVTQLARVQRELLARGTLARVKLACITYDPQYDSPERLRDFGEYRGVVFGADVRFFRNEGSFAQLRDWFDLGVGFGPTLVNRHRVELFFLDSTGQIVDSVTRRQWSVDEVVRKLEACVTPPRRRGRREEG